MDQSSVANVLGSVSDLLHVVKKSLFSGCIGTSVWGDYTGPLALWVGNLFWDVQFFLGNPRCLVGNVLDVRFAVCVCAAGCSQQDRLQLVRLNDKVLEAPQKLTKLSIFFNAHTHKDFRKGHTCTVYIFLCVLRSYLLNVLALIRRSNGQMSNHFSIYTKII